MAASPSTPARPQPLQRLNSPSLGLSALIHFAGVSSFLSSFKYLVDNPNPMQVPLPLPPPSFLHLHFPSNESYGWHFQYLTILGLTLATITFICGSLADITSSSQLFRLKNALSGISTPLEVLISILYWGIRSIDKTLVMPDWATLDLLPDLGFHFLPSALLVFDLLLLSPPRATAFFPSLATTSLIAASYWIWVEHCYTHNGWYPYPLFEKLNTVQRAMLFEGSALMMTACRGLLGRAYGAINGVGKRRVRVKKLDGK